jgi:hypothetical protein
MKTNTPSIPKFKKKWSSNTISKASARILRRQVGVHWDLLIRRGKYYKRKWLATQKMVPQKPKCFWNTRAKWLRKISEREQRRPDPILMKSFNNLEHARSNLYKRHLQMSKWLTNTILSQSNSNSKLILTDSDRLDSKRNLLFQRL